jgi:hypothetical protein
MDVSIAIGETHRFDLREALLIYTESRNSAFITRHTVSAQEAGPPTLGPAEPLTTAFVESLVRSLGGEAKQRFSPRTCWRRLTGCSAGGRQPENGRCSTTTLKESALS